MGVVLTIAALMIACASLQCAARPLDRSYWIHATLGASVVKGYWAREAPVGPEPTADEIRSAAKLLTGHYAANKLYLMYHEEVAIPRLARILRIWRSACPREVELVPALVLRMYDRERHEVFTEEELAKLCRAVKYDIGCREIAVYDVMPNRDQGGGLAVLAREFPNGLVRVGIQPEESIAKPFVAAVQDTWSGLCAGKSNEDWLSPGFGAETLRKWVESRNSQTAPVDWDLVAVAWDYLPTKRGEYPGYDDAEKNMPLPAGRNRLAMKLITETASPKVLGGFSSDLFIVEANSRVAKRDGQANSFYSSLKRGEVYRGYFSEPLEEIAGLFRELAGTACHD